MENHTSIINFFGKKSYSKNRFISESERLISNKIKITNSNNLEGFIVTVDFEKDFNHAL